MYDFDDRSNNLTLDRISTLLIIFVSGVQLGIIMSSLFHLSVGNKVATIHP